MKRRAFTLAETLITLTVIGVVAALTIPSLMTSYKERQFATAKTKAKNTLINGYRKMMAEEGGSFSDLPVFSCEQDFNCLSAAHKKVFVIPIDMSKTKNNLPESYQQTTASGAVSFNWADVPYIFKSADGSVNGLIFDEDSSTSFSIVTDLNGGNTPNKVSKDLVKFRITDQGEIVDATPELDAQNCECRWTEWFDADFPKYEEGGGDRETYEKIRRAGGNICEKPLQIECEAENYPGLTPEQVGQQVHCDLNTGLTCNNDEQLGLFKMCYNYRMRVLCCNNPSCKAED